MPILATLKKQSAGEWQSLSDYLREARHRETVALAALSAALSAPAAEQKELAFAPDAAKVLLELASDLRVPKGSRLAAARCLLEAGVHAQALGQLFIGAGDLVTDPRLGSTARKLVEGGLPAALQLGGEAAQVSLAAGAFARAVQASSSAVGQARTNELLEGAPEGHAGAAAGLHALGTRALPPDQLEAWKKLLETTCAKNRSAPAAARRVGLAPQWPPNLPDAFTPLAREAEEKSKEIVAADAGKNPAAGGRMLAPPIKRSPFRRPIGAVVEVPTALPPKAMEEVKGRARGPAREPQRPQVVAEGEAPKVERSAPLPIAALPSRELSDLKLDPRGRKVPRPDRWHDDDFQWEPPSLPSSDLPPPPRLPAAQGPFAQRVASLFEDRPEAVDRLCAAAEARHAVAGEAKLVEELRGELSRTKWKERRAPAEQLARLRRIECDGSLPGPWRLVARIVLQRL